MTAKFDKLAPGRVAKLNLAFDLILVAALTILSSGGIQSFDAHYGGLALIAMFAWFITVAVMRLYSPCTPRTPMDDLVLRLIAVASLASALALLEFVAYGDTSAFSGQTFFALLFTFSGIARLFFFAQLQHIDPPLDDVLIVGTGALGIATYERMRAITGERRRVVGFLKLKGEPETLPRHVEPPVLGEAQDLDQVTLTWPVSEVYVAGRVLSHGHEMQEVVSYCERVGLPFALPLHSLTFERATLLSNSRARDGYLHYLTNRARPVEHAVKRAADIVAATAGLILLSPLLLFTTLAIKITSRGPVFFKQVRVGLHGSHFHLLKFRSMVTNAEALKDQLASQNEQSGPVFKMKNDPRITPIGRFIRKYSIDELPQLINILRGDMSVVGPRPAVPKEVALYKAWQRRRLSVRPGLTCYWQVMGRNTIGFEEWMRLDLRYVDHWSLAVDVGLILQTVPVVVTGRGAS